MRKVILTLLFVAAAALADRLENTYLPPSSSKGAGGSGNFLQPPLQRFGGSSSKSYSSQSHTDPTFSAGSSSFGGRVGFTSYAPPASGPVSGLYGAPRTHLQNFDAHNSAPRGGGYSSGGHGQPVAAILRLRNDNNGDGTYSFEYETENRISQQESGHVKHSSRGADQESTSVVQGQYSYQGPDGKTYTVNYVADEHGFRAQGDHIPTPPPVPEAIQKSLLRNASGTGATGGGYHQAASQTRSDGGFSSYNQQKEVRPISRQYLGPRQAPTHRQSASAGYRY